MASSQATQFTLVLSKFKSDLSERQKNDFQFTSIDDLNVAIETIQRKQASERKLKAMQRLDRFLEGMRDFDKTIQTFVNSSVYLAFVWVSDVALHHPMVSEKG